MNALLTRLRVRLIDDLRRAWRFWTVQLHALMGVWLALYELAPVFPAQVAAVLPSPLQPKVIAGYALLGIVLRLVAQRKGPANAA